MIAICFQNVQINMQILFFLFPLSNFSLRLMMLFDSTNLLILVFVSFPHMVPMTDYLLIQYYFLSHSNCLDIVNFSLLLVPKMNSFPASLKVYHCISHSIPYLVLCFYLQTQLLKFVYVHNFNYRLSANSYKMMTTYILLHCIKLLCPKHLEYIVAFLCICLAKFLCAHLGSQLQGQEGPLKCLPFIYPRSLPSMQCYPI